MIFRYNGSIEIGIYCSELWEVSGSNNDITCG